MTKLARLLVPTTLDRWILGRFASTYAKFAFAILLVFIVTDGANRLGTFMESHDPLLRTMAAYYAALLPDIYYMLAPFVTLAAALWVVHDLRRNNELVPLMSAGVPPWRVAMPIFVAAALLAWLMYVDREYVIPAKAFAELRRDQSKFVKHDYLIPSPIPDGAGGVLSARFYEPKKKELDEARWTLLDEHDHETVSAIASTAVPVKNARTNQRGWLFRQGVLVRVEQASDGERVRVEPIPASGVLIETELEPLDVECAIVAISYLSTEQMRQHYEKCPFLRHLGVQLAKRFAYPCASVLLVLLGLPFVLRGDKTDAASGVLACIGICALFFLATAFCEDMGARPGGVHPVLAAWLPNIVFGVPGLATFLKVAR